MVRVTRPSRSRLRSVRVSMRCDTPLIRRLSSLNRSVPLRPSMPTTITLHLSPMRLSTSDMAEQLACCEVSVSDMDVPPCVGNSGTNIDTVTSCD
ncbi:hypothetical protein D3C71_2025430 [compost metagenome]